MFLHYFTHRSPLPILGCLFLPLQLALLHFLPLPDSALQLARLVLAAHLVPLPILSARSIENTNLVFLTTDI